MHGERGDEQNKKEMMRKAKGASNHQTVDAAACSRKHLAREDFRSSESSAATLGERSRGDLAMAPSPSRTSIAVVVARGRFE